MAKDAGSFQAEAVALDTPDAVDYRDFVQHLTGQLFNVADSHERGQANDQKDGRTEEDQQQSCPVHRMRHF
jgi:hypothetical protein